MFSALEMETIDNGKITLSYEEAEKLSKKINMVRCGNGFLVEGVIDKIELDAYKIIRDVILPSLHHIAQAYNPLMYRTYQGNMCRHATFYVTYFLKGMIPDREWHMYEMDYSAVISGKSVRTIHAFVVGEKNGQYRIIDMWDKLMPQIWVDSDKIEYPTWIAGAEEKKIIHGYNELSFDEYKSVTNEPLFGNTAGIMSFMDSVLGGYKIVNEQG